MSDLRALGPLGQSVLLGEVNHDLPGTSCSHPSSVSCRALEDRHHCQRTNSVRYGAGRPGKSPFPKPSPPGHFFHQEALYPAILILVFGSIGILNDKIINFLCFAGAVVVQDATDTDRGVKGVSEAEFDEMLQIPNGHVSFVKCRSRSFLLPFDDF